MTKKSEQLAKKLLSNTNKLNEVIEWCQNVLLNPNHIITHDDLRILIYAANCWSSILQEIAVCKSNRCMDCRKLAHEALGGNDVV